MPVVLTNSNKVVIGGQTTHEGGMFGKEIEPNITKIRKLLPVQPLVVTDNHNQPLKTSTYLNDMVTKQK